MHLPSDWLLLEIYPRATLAKVQNAMYIKLFIVTLFDQQKTGNNPDAQHQGVCWKNHGRAAWWGTQQLGYTPTWSKIYLVLHFKKINKFIYLCLFIYFWLRWVFVAAHGPSLVVRSGGYSLLWCAGFSLRWLLLWSMGSRHMGFSSCGWGQKQNISFERRERLSACSEIEE